MIDPLEPHDPASQQAQPKTVQPVTSRVSAHKPWRAGVALLTCLTLVAVAAVAVGASPRLPSPATGAGASPTATLSAKATTKPGANQRHGIFRRFLAPIGRGPAAGLFAGPHGGFGVGQVTITAIDGSSVSLKTADGWSRTITLGSGTKITKGGSTMSASQLKVGDQVSFRERRESDGSYTITALVVVVPTTGGQVTAKSDTTITIKRRDGSSQTIKVTGSTAYRVPGASKATLADVTVGMTLLAQGTANADGSFTASRVAAVKLSARKGPTAPRGPKGNEPRATPRPSAPPASNT